MPFSIDKQNNLLTLLEGLEKIPLNRTEEGNEVEIRYARQAKAKFRTFMKNLNIDSPFKGLTLSISFSGQRFVNWLAKIGDYMKPVGQPSAKVDELRIVLGMYSDDFTDLHNFNDENVGRLTVLIWPFKNGSPAPDPDDLAKLLKPYDLGGLYP
ncbi:MAG TPA: hypothetical protein VFW07_10705 [Parafilimonas sp.]|nr:hypothetical protein [Parafilimonas sp.]